MTGIPNQHTTSDTNWNWGFALLAFALFVWRYGYGFGFSDQDEFLPLTLHLLNADLYLNDWFVGMQTDGFSIRWPVALLIALPSTMLPVWAVVGLVHAAVALGSAMAVARLATTIFSSRWTTLLAVVAVMAVTSRWNPGGNDILHAMLVPSSIAWCMVLWSIERLHGKRWLHAGLFLGAATLFHPLIGMLVGLLLLATLLTINEVGWRPVIHIAVPFLLVLLPILALLASVGTGQASSDVVEAALDPTTILTQLRAPHHYLPGSFVGTAWAKFALLIVTASCLLWHDPKSTAAESTTTSWDRKILSRMIVLPTLALSASLLVTWWPIQWPLGLRLQPWSIAPMVRVVATIVIVGFGVQIVHSKLKARLLRPQPASRMLEGLIPLVGLLVLLLAFSPSGEHIRGGAHADQGLHDWAIENSDVNAVFVIPPSMTGFQFGAERAQYVSFKSFPFEPDPTIEWWTRLQQIAPVEEALPGGTALQVRLDEAYEMSSPADVRTFAAMENVDYFVRPAESENDWSADLEAEWCDEQWCVFWAGRILTQPSRPVTP